MAHAYSKLYDLPTTGLRFFTVYGPWGRPDMSPFLFIDAILHDRAIKVFNHGDMLRDFTYIDDIVEGVVRIVNVVPAGNAAWDDTNPDPATSPAPYRVYNIGNQHPTKLLDYIECIEKAAGRKAKRSSCPCSPATSTRPMPIPRHWARLRDSRPARRCRRASTAPSHGSENTIIYNRKSNETV